MYVYFSTGGGITGTFIAIDTLLDQMEREEHIDVFQVVQNLLLQRVNMVDNVVRNTFITLNVCMNKIELVLSALHLYSVSDITRLTRPHYYIILVCNRNNTSSSMRLFLVKQKSGRGSYDELNQGQIEEKPALYEVYLNIILELIKQQVYKSEYKT